MNDCYLPPGWSTRERKRAVRALMRGPRIAVPNDRAARWPLYALLVVAALAAAAGLAP